MKGQIVVCKDFTGTHLVRVAWDSNETLIFIHTRDQFDRRIAGEKFLPPVGFPRKDVFHYDEKVIAECHELGKEPWDKLTAYN